MVKPFLGKSLRNKRQLGMIFAPLLPGRKGPRHMAGSEVNVVCVYPPASDRRCRAASTPGPPLPGRCERCFSAATAQRPVASRGSPGLVRRVLYVGSYGEGRRRRNGAALRDRHTAAEQLDGSVQRARTSRVFRKSRAGSGLPAEMIPVTMEIWGLVIENRSAYNFNGFKIQEIRRCRLSATRRGRAPERSSRVR